MIARRLWILAVLALPRFAAAQAKPYSLTDILQLLQGGVSSGAVVARAQSACIDFKITSDIESVLHGANRDPKLITGLRAACYKLWDASRRIPTSPIIERRIVRPDTKTSPTITIPVPVAGERFSLVASDSSGVSTRREWIRENVLYWKEMFPDSTFVRYQIVDHIPVNGVRGTLLVREPDHALMILIPDFGTDLYGSRDYFKTWFRIGTIGTN